MELYNQDAECAVLSSIFREPELIKESRLIPSHFYYGANQLIFKALKKCDEKGIPIDFVSIEEQIKDGFTAIGGMGYITNLVSSYAIVSNFTFYEKLVLDYWKMREASHIMSKANEEISAGKEVTAIQDVISELMRIDSSDNEQDFNMIEILVEMYNEMEVDTGSITGVTTGFQDVDRILDGLKRQDLVIIAARPAIGKTAFMLNIAQHAVEKGKAVIGIFSLEMQKKLLLRRVICAMENINATKMRNPRALFQENDWEKTTLAMGRLEKMTLEVYDKPNVTLQEIWSKSRRLKHQHPNKEIIIMIDYLQLIRGDSKHKGNRVAEISEISRTLKVMARDLDITVVALSQLSRSVEQRQDKRPMLSDLRESGQIEQDADVVAFLYRDDYYNANSEVKNLVEVIVAKQRNGPIGTVSLAFVKEHNKFLSLERRHGAT